MEIKLEKQGVESMEFEPITKENIIEVLAKNKPTCKTRLLNLNSYIWIQDSSHSEMTIDFSCPNWLQVIEAFIGKKLEPLLKFDFNNYLIKNGFKNVHSTLSKNGIQLNLYKDEVGFIDLTTDSIIWIESTKENADILIKMSALVEKLK